MERRRPRGLTHPPRQPQSERAERMRARLLDATIACLAETGYGRMSTNDVVRRADVSRGALAHHYPAKADLVKAAAQRLIEQRALEFRERFRAMPPDRRTPTEALDVLWSFYDDPGAIALIELNVAARTHPELKAVMSPVSHQLAAITAEVFVEFFPDLARLPFAEEAVRAIHAMFGGLVLAAMADDGRQTKQAEVRAFLALLVSLSEQAAPMLASAADPTRSRP